MCAGDTSEKLRKPNRTRRSNVIIFVIFYKCNITLQEALGISYVHIFLRELHIQKSDSLNTEPYNRKRMRSTSYTKQLVSFKK